MDKIAAEMPLSLFYEWQAFASLNPLLFDAEYAQSRHDWNAAMVAARNILVLTSLFAKFPVRYQPDELMYKGKPAEEEQEPQTPKEIYLMFKTAVLLAAPKQHGNDQSRDAPG